MANVFFTTLTEINIPLIAALQKKGYETTVLTSTEEAQSEAKKLGAQAIHGYLDRPETYTEALKHSDIIFHTPGIYNLEVIASETATVDEIIKTIKGSKKTFIYTSHSWVLGDTNNVLADEKTPLSPISLVAPFAHNEKVVREAAGNDLRAIVVRTANVFGYEGDFVHEYASRIRREKAAHFIGNGENYFSVVAIDDLVELYLAVLEKGTAGAVYHAANGKALTTKEYATAFAKVFNVTEVLGLSQTELKARYGAYAEAYTLNQQISYIHTKEQLKWEPKQTDLYPYIQRVEKSLLAPAR